MSDHILGLIITGILALPPAYWGVRKARKNDRIAEQVAVAVTPNGPNGKNGLGASLIQAVGVISADHARLQKEKTLVERERDECLAREADLSSRVPPDARPGAP